MEHYQNRTLYGNALDVLKSVPDGIAQMCVTSPPYWGLRDYGEGSAVEWPDGWYGQLGLEPDPDLYVSHLTMIFNEVRHVLKDDGTLWLNIGDSYTHNGTAYDDSSSTLAGRTQAGTMGKQRMKKEAHGLKPKDLVGIPWRVAFALQRAGWYLRSEIIWHKPN